MASRSDLLQHGSRPLLRRLSASAETPTTRRSPREAARSMTRRWPTWKTSKVPNVITVRGMGAAYRGVQVRLTLEVASLHSTREKPRMRASALLATGLALASLTATAGCGLFGEDQPADLQVYSARHYGSEEVFKQFTKETGITV